MKDLTNIYHYHFLTIDFEKNFLSNPKKTILLSEHEVTILRELIANRGNIVRKETLLADLQRNNINANNIVLSKIMSQIRNKFEMFGFRGIIETKKGIGYRLIA